MVNIEQSNPLGVGCLVIETLREENFWLLDVRPVPDSHGRWYSDRGQVSQWVSRG